MREATLTQKLVALLNGNYVPKAAELPQLAELARLNKLYLAFLRRVNGLGLRREEERFKWFMRNTGEVASALRGLDYALFKFSRPFEHVSVDLDILIKVGQMHHAVHNLVKRGFRIIVAEPYTITLERGGFIVDLYTHPSFAWVVYMNGEYLLDYVEDIEVNGTPARALSKDAEVVVAAAHAVYKEHIYLLMDYFVIKQWLSSKAASLAEELNVAYALKLALMLNKAIESGQIEAPYRFPITLTARILMRKFAEDPYFRGTSLNALKLIVNPRAPRMLAGRLSRRSY